MQIYFHMWQYWKTNKINTSWPRSNADFFFLKPLMKVVCTTVKCFVSVHLGNNFMNVSFYTLNAFHMASLCCHGNELFFNKYFKWLFLPYTPTATCLKIKPKDQFWHTSDSSLRCVLAKTKQNKKQMKKKNILLRIVQSKPNMTLAAFAPTSPLAGSKVEQSLCWAQVESMFHRKHANV